MVYIVATKQRRRFNYFRSESRAPLVERSPRVARPVGRPVAVISPASHANREIKLNTIDESAPVMRFTYLLRELEPGPAPAALSPRAAASFRKS
ncbi:hypothetical protein EVAR_66033_1 [Eumeta japonica]|uniref:Uncharacterized protein n=1 Tax=Eumeta variegata TaxID=151549 RepID=A0A4C1Z9H0_EUMVA|nr:hypothetical protein EVAR_66033_1 [Eumeta japonica]